MSPHARAALARPTLTAEQEAALARRSAAGDPRAREELILAGLRWVALHALRLGHRGDAFEDAMQSGTVGLIQAIDRFDAGRGVRLSTFAWTWIARAMVRTEPVALPIDPVVMVEEAVDDSLLDCLPEALADVVSMRFGFSDPDGRAATRAEVAAALGLTIGQVRARETKALSHLRRRLGRVADRASSGEAGPL